MRKDEFGVNELVDQLKECSVIQKKNESAKKLTWKEKISYGFGDCGNGFMFDLGQAYLTKYWIDVCTLPVAAVAGIFAFTKIFDAFMDPIAGSIIDGRKHIGAGGKFRPVMMLSSIFLGLFTIVTFTMPDVDMGWKILFAYAVYMAWGLVYSFTNIPYGSLASVMTRDVNERSQLATTRQVGSISAQLLTGVGFVPILMLFSNPHQGFFVASFLMAKLKEKQALKIISKLYSRISLFFA